MILIGSHKFQSKPFRQRLIPGVRGEQRADAARIIDRERQELKVLQIAPVQNPLQKKDVMEGVYGAQALEVTVLQAAPVLLLDIKRGIREAIFRECVHDMDAVVFPCEPENSCIPAPDIHFRVGQYDTGEHNGVLVEFLKHHPVKLVQELQVQGRRIRLVIERVPGNERRLHIFGIALRRFDVVLVVPVDDVKVLALVVSDVEAGLALRLQTQRLMKQMVAQTQLLCLDLRIQRFDSKHYLYSFLLLSQIHDIIPVFCFFGIQY